MPQKGVAISLYDKFEDLELLLDIFRNNFDDDYYIVVCSEHEEAEGRLKNLDIDETVESSEIDYEPSGVGNDISRDCRILESIRSTCKACIDAGCEYVTHIHADAWFLEEGKIDDIIDLIEEKEVEAAFRGKGAAYRTPQYSGHFMDQFFLLKSQYFRETSFFDFRPVEMMPHGGIHNSLALLIMGSLGRSNYWLYSDMSGDVYWDGESRINPVHVRPAIYNREWGLLHVARDEFPSAEDYGSYVQAKYLQTHGLTNGENISSFLEDCQDYERKLDELSELEDAYNRKLRLWGHNPRYFNVISVI